jgi:hypothetical protein
VERFLIFISYRRGESAGYAGRLHESLERRLGDGHVFRDVDELEPGQDFVDAITARLRDCAACVVMIGQEWLLVTDRTDRRRLEQPNDYVRLEIEAALARPDLLVVPVLVEGTPMPSAEDLPDTIRALSRRHALSLRDETWDADVDRLVTALEKTIGRRTLTGDLNPISRLPRLASGTLVAWSAIAAALVVAAMFLNRSTETTDPGTTTTTTTVESSGVRTGAPARAIVLPRLAEVVHEQLIYTVLSGDIASSGNASTLRLRIRLSNEGGNPTNFWDSSFRLAVPGQVLAPTSGLNEFVSGHVIQQGVITFDVPAGAVRAALRVIGPSATAEIPLELGGGAAPSSVDNPDTGDALSRAQVVRVAREAVALVDGKEISYTLVSMIARRFVNALRIIATVRVANRGPYPWHFGADAIRLLVDGQPVAPVIAPNSLAAAAFTMSGDYVFDVPPAVQRVVLRVTSVPGADVAFDLPRSPP